MGLDRRQFLRLLGTGGAIAALPLSIRKALAIPAHHRTGTIADVEHIVVFMRENRAFDQYFGFLRGVRGFGDPHPARLKNGAKVWAQPGPNGPVLPFRPNVSNLGMTFLEDLDHSWDSTHYAWSQGWYDGWVREKGPTTMAHMVRRDMPFHYALADAFTVCDAYHCSVLGPTYPNRMYMWTGWVGNDGRGGGPVPDDWTVKGGWRWKTYPERLEQAGISWKIYQDIGPGLDAEHNWGESKNPYQGVYSDNILLYFKSYQNSAPGSPLYQKARTGTHAAAGESLFHQLQRDVRDNHLPQVSWIIAPEAYSEHPDWPVNYGAWYDAQVLDALTSNPDVWSKTVLFIMHDENDGYFDHVVPPTPPTGTVSDQSTISIENTIFPGFRNVRGPYGLGPRVPMLVISPWSKGGWVSSEVFDHTSLLRFIEKRFGVHADNITPWRRAVCGDLTSTLDFASLDNSPVALPDTSAYAPPNQKRHHRAYKPTPPSVQHMPAQEPGQRPGRPVPYELHVVPNVITNGIELTLRNTGAAAAVFQVRSHTHIHEPRCYTVGAKAELRGNWKSASDYALEVHGPNGFYRTVAGKVNHHPGELELLYHTAQNMVELRMSPLEDVQLTIRDAYTHRITTHDLPSGRTWHHCRPLLSNQGWYDLDVRCMSFPSFRRCFAGHLETGANSKSDPRLGRSD